MSSLLLLLPLAADGQTSVSLRKYETPGWSKTLLHGGTIRTLSDDGRRTGSRYLTIQPSGSSLLRMDFVNGFTVGPDFTMGRVYGNYGRLEQDVALEWACSRREPMWALTTRYILPPEYHAQFELFTTLRTRDYDSSPLMDVEQQGVAVGLFGWNGFKLYNAFTLGARGHFLPLRDLLVMGGVWFEARETVENHRRNNIFGLKPDANLPYLRGRDVMDYLYNDYELWRADLSLVYQPGSKLYIVDDMNSSWRNDGPMFTLNVQTGWSSHYPTYKYNEAFLKYYYEKNFGSVPGSDDVPVLFGYTSMEDPQKLNFVSLSFSVRQAVGAAKDANHFEYYAAGGFFPTSHLVDISDMHHFDAAHFGWQNHLHSSLTWFSLLCNYELSSSRPWMELHTEYRYEHNEFFAQYAQLHFAAVEGMKSHTELSYGWQLARQMRVGFSVGLDACRYDGLGLNVIVEL